MLQSASILVTGGTGSFGHTFIPLTLQHYNPKRIVVYSREEMKQWEMAKLFRDYPPDARIEYVGIRPGEKLHEQMIGAEDSFFTYEYPEHFKILPSIQNWSNCLQRIGQGRRVAEGFTYTSDGNGEWMSVETLQNWIAAKVKSIGTL
jgi:UDP-N-acetylglucosamine 4,6-dehydratase